MAYKKYIKKNGKIYGPYIYHSKRVDGKVVSEYRGSKEKSIVKLNKTSKRNFVFIFAAIFLVLFLSLFFTLKSGDFSGNVILNLESQYQEDQPLEGVLSIELKEGEMVPETSKVIFENAGNSHEYNLNELVSTETINGNLFVEGQDSLGQGSGYGLIGKQVIYPNVYFEFKVIEEATSSSGSSSYEVVAPEEEVIDQVGPEEDPIADEVVEGVIEEEVVVSEEPIEEVAPGEEPVALEEGVSSSEGKEVVEEEPVVEEVIEEESVAPEESVPSNQVGPEDEGKEVIEEAAPEEESSEPSITGNIVQGVLGAISNVFVGLTPTGKAISGEVGDQIQADVSYGEEIRYVLGNNQNIEIVSNSVRTDTKELSIENLQIFREGNEVIIKTNYYEETSGFGEKYLGEETKNLDIDLSTLGLKFEDPNLKVKLVYEEKEFRSFEVNLGESFIETEELSSEEDEFVLTDEEKVILNSEFGDEIVAQTARSYKDWIIVSFSLGEYSVEYSYNKDLSKEELDSLIVKDKLNWLKDISKELTTDETPSFTLDEFNVNYDLS